jgi:hypothetical protein
MAKVKARVDVTDAEIDRAIVALGDPLTMFKDASEDPEASEGIIARLPQLVSIVSRYWLERSQKPRARKGAAKASPAKPSAVRTGASKPNAARTPAKPAAQSQTVHRLRIALRGVRPPVWRRLEVPSDTKLPALNQILQAAMGWMDMHLPSLRALTSQLQYTRLDDHGILLEMQLPLSSARTRPRSSSLASRACWPTTRCSSRETPTASAAS